MKIRRGLQAVALGLACCCATPVVWGQYLTDSLPGSPEEWERSSDLTQAVHALESATVEAHAPGAAPPPLHQVQRIEVDVLDAAPAASRLLAIGALPGVSFQTATGGMIRPIVRGLSGLRVTTMFYGARIESQAWGDHHGIFLPEEGIERVEVARGASTLADAPDALGGILKFIPIGPDPEVGRKSALRLTGHSNTEGFQASLVTRKRSERAYHTFSGGVNRHGEATLPDGSRIAHSDFRQFYAQGRYGYLRDWGTWDGAYTSAYNTAGLLATGGWHQSGDHLITSSLHVQGQRGWIWHPTFSYQLNHRKEFGGGWGAADAPDALAELDLSLRTTRLDLRVERTRDAWDAAWGVQSGQKSNTNGPIADSLSPFIPDAAVREAGAFVQTGWQRNELRLSGLARADVRHTEFATGASRNFPMVSAGIGAQWRSPNAWTWTLNLARKNRAPGLAELGAQGIHHSVNRVEWGRDDLGVETGHQVEFTAARPLRKGWTAEATAYHQVFSNFLYLAETNEQLNGLPVFIAAETQAQISGVEFSGIADLNPHWTAKWAASAIHAVDSEGNALPLIPPANVRLENRWHCATESGRRWDAQFIVRASTEAVLLDAGASMWWNDHVRTSLTGSNLLNTRYRTILSQLNNLGMLEPGRNVKLRVEWHF